MPSMMENIVMKKCKVKFTLARTIVNNARESLPKENQNILWSKSLEAECMRIYYEQYGVKLGLAKPSTTELLLGDTIHSHDTSNTYANSSTKSISDHHDESAALKKSRSIGKITLLPSPLKSPRSNNNNTGSSGIIDSILSDNNTSSRSLRQKTLKTTTTTLSQENTLESPTKSPSERRRHRSQQEEQPHPRNLVVVSPAPNESGHESEGSHQTSSTSRRSIRSIFRTTKKAATEFDGDMDELSSSSAHSAKSSSSNVKAKRKVKKTSSILDNNNHTESGKRDKTTKKRRSFKQSDTAPAPDNEPFQSMEPPMSPSLSEYISSSPSQNRHGKSPNQRLTAGMHGFDAPAASRDTTPYKPKVDKSPRKTPRKASLLLHGGSMQVPTRLLDAEPAIRKAFENQQQHDIETQAALDPAPGSGSPNRILIRCKKTTRPKLRDNNNTETQIEPTSSGGGGGTTDNDNISIGPDDLLKRSPERKKAGSFNSSRLDGNNNSSRTKMVPVVRPSSSPKRRGSNTTRNSFKETQQQQQQQPERQPRPSRRSSSPEALLFDEGFLVSPSRETSLDKFHTNINNRRRACPTRQDSAQSFLSIESFSEPSPFDSPVPTSLITALPALPTLSPMCDTQNMVVFDAETVVSSSQPLTSKPLRQLSTKPRRFR